jgi:type IV fimbrial biogenesis protein FimT
LLALVSDYWAFPNLFGVRVEAVTKVAQKGFNLIELMVVIAIASILLMVAVPGFQTISQRSLETNTVNNLAAMVGRARSEAVTRNRDVVICVSVDQTSCNVGSPLWESGWIMYAVELGGATTLLQIGQTLPAGVTIRSSGFPADSLTLVRGTGLPTTAGTFRYCDARGVPGMRALNVGATGQSRVATDANADGTPEDFNGAELTVCP